MVKVNGNPIVILMADDDADDRMLTRDALEESRVLNELRFVEDGEELMQYLTRQGKFVKPEDSPRPGLILLDLNMPNKNGLECLAEIRTDNVLKNIPVVVLSTSKDIRDIELCYTKGANLFFSKPYTFGSLKTLIHSILNIDWLHFPKQMDKSEFVRISSLGLNQETLA